jgi:3-hydroxyisobutyrate dehydrogenase
MKELDLVLVDAPITQIRVHAIDSGDATIMVGSDSQEAVDKILPVLRAMGKYIFHMGGLGTGHAMKTFNNYCSAAAIMATADSLVAGQKFGLDPIQMIDVLNVGTGSSFPTLNTFNDEALPRRYASGFQLALLIKDVGISKELFENVGFKTPLPDVVIDSLSHAMSTLKPDADHTESLKGWEKRAGLKLKTGRAEGKTMIQ